IELGMLLLPEFKGDKSNEVAGKYAVDAMVFRNDAVAQHTGVLILALFFHGDRAIRKKIIARVDDASMRIEAVAIVIYVVAQHVKPATDRYRNVGSLCEELEQELQKLPASVFVLLRNITLLSFNR